MSEEAGAVPLSAPDGAQRDGAAQEAAPGEYPDPSGTDLDAAERSVVHTASVLVQVEDLDAAATDAKQWVRDNGGYVSAESASSTDSANPTMRMTLKVPSDHYEQALEEFSALGDRKSLDRYAEDVTEEVADVDSRVDSAEASLGRLRDLLEEAGTVDEVLEIEGQLSTRQADLEALQARQRVLAESTAYGTVDLSLALPSSVVPPSDDDSPGFLGGLASGWRALTAVVDVLVVAFAWLLPFLAVFALAAAPAVWLVRRSRARREAAAHGAPRPAEPVADDLGT
ncbi:DUF4349 domain-containing protein [Actinorugispora endophytica]|uniref:Uncharacterized protein DUF4349 n=1 Tax=Actinorugispora endophytica TaxID=1605990 RepID=A0A4R6UTN3_9ACTN|nr:DUF4349 domain-containing protein [Actinorugispora endophytica]TDQ49616.1 uncharacterized protein DUF4349 [Actinorugispora endophytica]